MHDPTLTWPDTNRTLRLLTDASEEDLTSAGPLVHWPWPNIFRGTRNDGLLAINSSRHLNQNEFSEAAFARSPNESGAKLAGNPVAAEECQ
jgi:hypothetical protein